LFIWNQDNKNGTIIPFALDPNENPVTWYGDTGSGIKTYTGNITVPLGISPCQINMRVMLDTDSGGSNGGDFTCNMSYGEFEDYVLNVTSAAPTLTGVSSVSGPTSGGKYLGNSSISGATSQYIAANKIPGIYKVVTVDKLGCQNSSGTITAVSSKSLNVFPNPASDSFTLKLSGAMSGRADIDMFNANGLKVLEIQAQNVSEELIRESGLLFHGSNQPDLLHLTTKAFQISLMRLIQKLNF
jgi:hypothetical protein